MNPASIPLYQAALAELHSYSGSIRGHKGRFTQLFIALKFYQDSLPSIHSGPFVSTELIQGMLDDLFAKRSLPPNQCVLSLFESNHLARTGFTAPGNRGPQNTWRNNLNLQKGIGCYAPINELSSQVFLNQSRAACRHLTTPGQLDGATCNLCTSSATYRREDHRKWLRIDPGGNGYAVVDLLNTSNFSPYVAPDGHRLPLLPVMAALYHDADPGLSIGQRGSAVSTADFLSDFNFSPHEAATYFDDARTNPHNAALLAAHGANADYEPIGQAASPPLPTPAPTMRTRRRPVAQNPAGPAGSQVPPPQTNSGWEAEQYVASALRTGGWVVHDVSRQQMGYDLFATRGRETRRIEVKSSLGYNTPSLTAREWQQATHYRDDYILAVLENFRPQGENVIYWVPDPARRCAANAITSVSHAISRSSWTQATVPLTEI